MLMVIFGAGASYDSSAAMRPKDQEELVHKGWRPPLANELFEPRMEFDGFLKRYPRCRALAPFLRDRTDNRSVEAVLSEFQAQSEANPARPKQLAAIKFYLRDMLWGVQENWLGKIPGGTNYDALVDEIDNLFRDESVCFVTFNYDT